jgi:hypothetical protein
MCTKTLLLLLMLIQMEPIRERQTLHNSDED